MKAIFALFLLVSYTQAGTVLPTTYVSRAPAFDSAVIKSDRIGGNFAYSVAETHAYAAHSPIVAQHVSNSFTTGEVTYAAPASVTYTAGLTNPSAFGYASGLPVAYAAPKASVAKLL